MRQTLSISVFVNFRLSFQPSCTTYTMLASLCLLQIITAVSPYQQTIGSRLGATKSPPCGRCGYTSLITSFDRTPYFLGPQLPLKPSPIPWFSERWGIVKNS